MLVGDIIRQAAHRHPDRVALVAGERRITYAQLDQRVRRLANALGTLAEPGDRVAILADNLPEYVEAYYGVPAAGMALTFLNYRLHPKEWAWILDDAEARVVLVQASYLERLAPVLDGLASVTAVVVIGEGDHPWHDYEALLARASTADPRAVPREDDTAWLLYTSGTTGFPKGAMLSHRNLLTSVVQSMVEHGTEPDERKLIAFPLCHVSGSTVLVNHLRGGQIVLTPQFEAEAWMALVEQHGITSTSMAPTMLAFVLHHPRLARYRLDSLRAIGYGAAAMPVEVLREAIDRFGPVVYSGYGMTELAGNVLFFPRADHVRASRDAPHLLGSCGRQMVLSQVRVVDGDGQDCAPGEVGEIVVRGDQVLTGYFGNPAATVAAFAGGWFHTGDLARRDEEGFFTIVDRLKDMIISGGENVYSREVEEALYAHPGVAEAAVVGLPDPTWGERVTAVVVPRPGVAVTAEDVVAVARARLAGYKAPRQVVFVDALPKTVSGKIVKRDLRSLVGKE